MRNLKFYIGLFFLLIFTSCNKGKEIAGNWYSCLNNGYYIEMLIKDNLYKFSTNDKYVSNWCKFTINGDTLMQFDQYLFEDSVVINKAIIQFINDDQITLDYITSDENWTFYRIKEPIDDIDNDLKLLKGTLQRSKMSGCIDKRTEEEKLQDSIYRPIDFQF